jgi:squalene-associated FAD-dependent desaturase
MNVAVIGGGVSGIRAALTLAHAGVRTVLFEKNRHLGGRVFSFPLAGFGEVDIGQHIWLRCCAALEELLADLKVPDDWVYRQDRVAMTYRWPDGSVRTLGAGRLPGSLGLLPLVVSAPLSAHDRYHLLRGTARAWLYSDRALDALDAISFADWLQAQRQPRAVVQWFWEPFVVGVCNGRLAEISARYGLFAVRESLLKSARGAAICLLRCPLSAVFDRRAREVLQQAGVEVRTGEFVREVRAGDPVLVRGADGRGQPFDRAILALPLKRLRALLPNAELPPTQPEGAIAGLLLRFAQPVMAELFFTAVGSPVQIVFNKSAIWRQQPEDGSQLIELVISAAEREVRLGVERVTAELLPELAKLLPRVAQTPLLVKHLLVHATATFRVSPGGEARRLATLPAGLPNVILAGDQARTGWPSTMESAVRAGQAAARAILDTTRSSFGTQPVP